jgi:hypothetical protein
MTGLFKTARLIPGPTPQTGGDIKSGSVFPQAIGTYDDESLLFESANLIPRDSKGDLKMPTTIPFPASADMTSRPTTTKSDRLDSRNGLSILMVWALIMLLIGAAAHFGVQSPDLGAFELLASF